LAGSAMLGFAAAVTAALGDEASVASKVEKGVVAFICDGDHVAPVAPVATGRSAVGPEFFSQKSDAAVAAVTRCHLDAGFI
jgi:hypothetical protein